MAFVQFSKVSLAFGDRDILKNVSVSLAAGKAPQYYFRES